MNRIKSVRLIKSLFGVALTMFVLSCAGNETVFLKKEFSGKLRILCDDLLKLQMKDTADANYGALYCANCNDYHTRASESVLPFAVAFKETGDRKYLNAAVATGEWLIAQQKEDGSWIETPSDWMGTTTDQLLMLASAYPVIKNELSEIQNANWLHSINAAAFWLVKNMNHEFASINYCATTTATLMAAFKVIPDSSFVKKADELAELVCSKFDEDYFLAGEGNRIFNTKYGVDLGYNMDMSVWGLGLYAKLRGNTEAENYARESLRRMLYFIYPDGSTDNSWGVRSSKWTTFGSFTADGSQILFSLFAGDDPAYRTAALANMNYFMSMKVNGLITYGPGYYDIFQTQPCVYPTFCRAKNLAMAILYGEQKEGPSSEMPSQKYPWAKYFETLNVTLVRTENYMATVTAYGYKDIRRGADFKYMHCPSGGSITNLWVEDYGYLQASGQTEYQQWEFNYPAMKNAVSITPRIEFTDTSIAAPANYFTNLYEFDSHTELNEDGKIFRTENTGELKNRNRWEGGVAYTLTQTFSPDYIEKNIKLRFHGRRPEVSIVEPFVLSGGAKLKKINGRKFEITGGKRSFTVGLLSDDLEFEFTGEEYAQSFPAIKAYPLIIRVKPDEENFIKEVRYSIHLRNSGEL